MNFSTFSTQRATSAYPSSKSVTVVARVLAFGLAVVGLVGLTGPAAMGASGTKPPRAYFGMHYHGVGDGSRSWPEGPVGLMRLWDTGTTWKDLQPDRNSWNFSVLDEAVRNARSHNAQTVLVLGQTPAWASSRPNEGGAFYGAGVAAPPASISDWWIYANTMATRYRGRIQAYEIWNEANLPGFYSGSVAQLVRLTRVARDAIKRADPKASVIGPSVTLRTGTKYLRKFARAGGYRYSDVVNIHGYPQAKVGPEGGVAMIEKARREISRYKGGRKPIWNTELNYGLQHAAGDGTPVRLTAKRQAAYVARAYLLNWSHGVRRLAWYDWGTAPFEGVRMSAGGAQAAAPGKAFGVVREWMRGHVGPIHVGGHGVYSATIRYSAHRWGSVRWTRSGTRVTVAPKGTYVRRSVIGQGTRTRSQARVRIGQAPVLFRYHR